MKEVIIYEDLQITSIEFESKSFEDWGLYPFSIILSDNQSPSLSSNYKVILKITKPPVYQINSENNLVNRTVNGINATISQLTFDGKITV